MMQLHIPGLTKGVVDPYDWSITVYLDMVSGYPTPTVGSRDGRTKFSGNKLIFSSLGKIPDSGIKLNFSLRVEETVYRWKFPCLLDVSCSLPYASVTSLLGNIIISCVALTVTILLFICVKCCQCKAKRNDKKKAEEEAKKPKPPNAKERVVIMIPAKNHPCRLNTVPSYRNVNPTKRSVTDICQQSLQERGGGRLSLLLSHLGKRKTWTI